MNDRKTKINKKKLAGLIAFTAALVLLIIWLFGGFSGRTNSGAVNASQLPCTGDENVQMFGQNIVYYDGGNILCVGPGGDIKWRFSIGIGAEFDAGDEYVAVWNSNQLYILDSSGNVTYNDAQPEPVQFAVVGKKYVCAAIGENTATTLLIKDIMGQPVDTETETYENLLLLDMGFFGDNGQYMWTLSMDIYSTAANTVLNLFEVSKMNSGEVDLGSDITYDVVYTGSEIDVFSTRKMRVYTTKGTENTAAAQLIYGWKLADISMDNGVAYLLTSTGEISGSSLRELRVLLNGSDKRFTLPENCAGALLRGQYLYAISAGKIFRCPFRGGVFEEYNVTGLKGEITGVLGKTTDGKAVIRCGNLMYSVPLP